MVAEVLRDPQDVTVYENKFAVFLCEIRGDTSTWRVNTTYLSELPHMLRSMINILKNSTDDNRKSTELSITPMEQLYNVWPFSKLVRLTRVRLQN